MIRLYLAWLLVFFKQRITVSGHFQINEIPDDIEFFIEIAEQILQGFAGEGEEGSGKRGF